MQRVQVKYKQLSLLATMPSYESEQAAGMDVYAAIESGVAIMPSKIAMIPLGFAMALPEGYEAQVRPRSGLASKFGVTLPNAPGTIDADYRGEVKVPLINLSTEVFTIEPNMRIAQMIIAPVVQANFKVVEELCETVRGTGGFGSTGA